MATKYIDPVTAQRRRTLLIAGVLSAVVILIAAGVTLAILATRPARVTSPLTPAEQTTASPSPSAAASASISATSSLATSSPSTASSSVAATSGIVVRSGQIAYRLGGSGPVWVANQDGSGAKALEATSSVYSLSPDGRTIVTKSASGSYILIDVATGTGIAPEWLATATPVDLPTWAPDSSWLAYTAEDAAGNYSIYRVDRNGAGAALVLKGGAGPQISPDGKRVAFSTSLQPGPSDPLKVYDLSTKKTQTLPAAKGAVHYAWTAGGTLYYVTATTYATATTPSRVGWLGKLDRTLSKSSVVASLPTSDPNAHAPGELVPSPDGSKVLFSMTGDDGYSRMMLGDSGKSKITAIATGNDYDAYPLAWLLDGSAVLYIEGNAYQHEATNIYRIRTDGSQRTLVVRNAGT